MSDKDLEKRVVMSDRAAQVLQDPLITGAIDEMRQTAFDNWRTSSFKDTEEREELYKMVRAIDEFEAHFKRRVNDGKVAKSQLDQLTNGVKKNVRIQR